MFTKQNMQAMIITEFHVTKAQTNEIPQVPWHVYTEPNLQTTMTSQTQLSHIPYSNICSLHLFYLTIGTQCYKNTLCLQHHLAASSACFWAAVSLVALKCCTSSHYVYFCTCITDTTHSQNLYNTPVWLHGHTGELFMWFQFLHIVLCKSAS